MLTRTTITATCEGCLFTAACNNAPPVTLSLCHPVKCEDVKFLPSRFPPRTGFSPHFRDGPAENIGEVPDRVTENND